MVAVPAAMDVDPDQRVVLNGMSWQDYEAMLAIRGDRAGVRMYYLDGAIEIMSPTKIHEDRKKTLARLLEMWANESGIDLDGFGSWTLKHELAEAGAEPDECYILGNPERERPDLVIEVEWSRRVGVDKQEIYRRLGVRELWTLKSDKQLVIRVLEQAAWIVQARSALLPNLDLPWLLAFLDITPQSKAVRALSDAMRAPTAR